MSIVSSVIAVQKGGGDEARADEEKRVAILAVVPDQREAADGKRLYRRDRFHQGVQLDIAAPCRIPEVEVSEE